jgi:DNA adenine methylase
MDADYHDLVYFDPPYIPTSATASFTSYTADGFGHEDQVRLRNIADTLRTRGVHVLLSNSDTPLTRDLYKGWTLHEVRRRGNVSCKGDGRQSVGELIISSEAP